MAKWGEGDPRWIVEERPDATNVNNWHWTEKNATPWSKDKLRALFDNFEISESGVECQITEVEKLNGEACANNRKGKLIFFYEWNIALKWEGHFAGDTKNITKGTAVIPNLSEENDIDDIEVEISINESNSDSENIKTFMYNIGRDKLRKQVEVYIKELREEFSKGMILPKKDGELKKDAVKTITSGFNKKIDMSPQNGSKAELTSKDTLGLKLDVTTIKCNEKFQCKSQDFYSALTRSEMVTAFTRAYVKLDAVKGGEFSLFGGNVTGKFLELVPNKKIVQLWRLKQWPSGHFSTVTIEIDEKDDHTDVNLTQTGVPTSESDTTKANWERYYWTSMKQTFGFGSFLV